ncbi:holin [Mycobacterium phage Pharaoh]|uniref:Holin n=1 Tax=Mycobacterium phage Pharaoh TaxID=2530140 RepID=A0A481W1V4_9CAUD|nr:holin [Mycobacterium phage Pharaoh]QBJ00200.1 holin [Mycobacterium phage Pharaoh]
MNIALYSKAIVAFLVALASAASLKAGGPDHLSTLAFGDWIGIVGAALVSGGAVFAAPANKSKEEPAPALSPTEIVTGAVQQVVDARQQAQADLVAVTQVLKGAADVLPVFGDEARDLINKLPQY